MNRREAIKRTTLLAGSATATPVMISLLQTCKSRPELEWQPIFLTSEEAKFISLLVDTWLPKTETPGALEMKVDMFIDLVFARLYDPEAQSYVKTEIENFNANCKEEFGNSFIELNEEDRREVLKIAESKSGKYGRAVWGTAVGKQENPGFYRSLKSMALWGYFTSEDIGKTVLNYDPIPQEYLGCIPLSEVGNRWSL